jgi:hypothetical protein
VSHWLDDAARGLAEGTFTRRAVLRRSGTVAGGALLASVTGPLAAFTPAARAAGCPNLPCQPPDVCCGGNTCCNSNTHTCCEGLCLEDGGPVGCRAGRAYARSAVTSECCKKGEQCCNSGKLSYCAPKGRCCPKGQHRVTCGTGKHLIATLARRAPSVAGGDGDSVELACEHDAAAERRERRREGGDDAAICVYRRWGARPCFGRA